MSKKRIYTEKDISSVLERATELQRAEGLDDPSGLTLEELEQVAEDVGIDPDFVKRAATELAEDGPDTGFYWLGGPTTIDLERVVDGEFSETKWEEAIGEIRRAFHADGEVAQEGRTLEWVHRDEMGGRVHLSIWPVKNQTRIRLTYRMTEWLFLSPIMLVAIAPIAMVYSMLQLGALVETGISLLIIFAFCMIGWLSFRAFTRRQESKTRKLLDRLDSLIAEAADVEQVEQIATPAGGRIDASLLSDDVPSGDASSTRHSTRDASTKRR